MRFQAQPYRQGPRHPGAALTAMLRGRTAGGYNPSDIQRMAQKMSKGSRTVRQTRPTRPTRPTR